MSFCYLLRAVHDRHVPPVSGRYSLPAGSVPQGAGRRDQSAVTENPWPVTATPPIFSQEPVEAYIYRHHFKMFLVME